MLASVIVPAYRAKNTAPIAVMSALRQTWSDLEVIVVDDASLDGTPEAIEAAAGGDSRFRLIRLHSNCGPSGARNVGLRAATGKWITFLDSDDSFDKERLATLIPKAISLKADLLSDNLHVTWANGSYPNHLAFPASRMLQRDCITPRDFAASDRPRWGLRAAGYMKPIFRRAFLADHNLLFSEDFRCFEDFYFFMQCLFRGAKLFYSDYAGYNYSVRSGSLSANSKFGVETNGLAVNRLLMQEAIGNGDQAALEELRRRENDLKLWDECLEIRNALQMQHYYQAAKIFWRIKSKPYALARFSEKAGKDIAMRLGRTQY